MPDIQFLSTFVSEPPPPPPPGSNSYPLISFVDPDNPTREEVERLAQERWHTQPDWVVNKTTPKTLGANFGELPAGITYDVLTNTLTFRSFILLDGWDFSGALVAVDSGHSIGTISNCKFASPAVAKSGRVAHRNSGAESTVVMEWGVNNSTVINLMRRCWFTVADGHAGGPFSRTALINHGTTDNATYPFINVMEFCSFEGYGMDAIKSSIGGIRRYCFFDVAWNIPDDATAWNPDATYNAGDVVYSEAQGWMIKLCLNNGVTSAPNFSSVTASTADWAALDPHSDHDQGGQSPPSGCTFLGCFWNRDETKRRFPSRQRARGLVSAVRRNAYGGGGIPNHGSVYIRRCIFTPEVEANTPGQTPIAIGNNRIHPGSVVVVEWNHYFTNFQALDVNIGPGSNVTVANNILDYDYWPSASITGVSANYSGGVLSYTLTPSIGGWVTIVVTASSAPMTAKEIIDAFRDDTALVTFQIDCNKETATTDELTVALTSGTRYVHALYQAGGGIDTLIASQTITA